MTPKQNQEELSKAYVYAVAAACGYKVGTWSQDDDCLDVTLAANIRRSPKVDIQLKSTRQDITLAQGALAWKLSRAHYIQLSADAITPRYLVLLQLPDKNEGLLDVEVTVEHLLLRKCAFFLPMTGLTPIPDEQKNITVHLPQSNVFSPDALRGMMEAMSRP